MTYRLLDEGENTLPTDEQYYQGVWTKVGERSGDKVIQFHAPFRRELERPQRIESNDICDYCAIDYASTACRGCLPVNGRAGFQGKKVRAL